MEDRTDEIITEVLRHWDDEEERLPRMSVIEYLRGKELIGDGEINSCRIRRYDRGD